MNNKYFIIISLISLFYVVWNVKKKKFSIKESFLWVIGTIIMVILSIFPYSIDKIAEFFKVSYAPSLLFVFSTIFLLFISFKNSNRISEQQEKIVELAQELAILKAKNK